MSLASAKPRSSPVFLALERFPFGVGEPGQEPGQFGLERSEGDGHELRQRGLKRSGCAPRVPLFACEVVEQRVGLLALQNDVAQRPMLWRRAIIEVARDLFERTTKRAPSLLR